MKDHPEASLETFQGIFFSTPGHTNGLQKPVPVAAPSSILTVPLQNSAGLHLDRGRSAHHDQVSAPIQSSTSVQQSNTISSLVPPAPINNTVSSLQETAHASNRPLEAPNSIPDGSEILARLAQQKARLYPPPYSEPVDVPLRTLPNGLYDIASQALPQMRNGSGTSSLGFTNKYARGPVSVPITQLPKKSLRKPRARLQRNFSTPQASAETASTPKASTLGVNTPQVNTPQVSTPEVNTPKVNKSRTDTPKSSNTTSQTEASTPSEASTRKRKPAASSAETPCEQLIETDQNVNSLIHPQLLTNRAARETASPLRSVGTDDKGPRARTISSTPSSALSFDRDPECIFLSNSMGPHSTTCANDSFAQPLCEDTFANHGQPREIVQPNDISRQSDRTENFLLCPQGLKPSILESPFSFHQPITQNSTLSKSALLHTQKPSNNTQNKPAPHINTHGPTKQVEEIRNSQTIAPRSSSAETIMMSPQSYFGNNAFNLDFVDMEMQPLIAFNLDMVNIEMLPQRQQQLQNLEAASMGMDSGSQTYSQCLAQPQQQVGFFNFFPWLHPCSESLTLNSASIFVNF